MGTRKMKKFVNLSNHSSNTWSNMQLEEARKYGDIVDIEFPSIDPYLTKDEVKELNYCLYYQSIKA